MRTMTGTLVEARPASPGAPDRRLPPHTDDDELQALSRSLMGRSSRPPTTFGLYLLRSHDPAAELARRVEHEVFGEAFGNTPELLAEEYGPYEPASVYCCVLDHRRARPVGALRLILPGPAGLKSLVDVERGWGRSGTELLAATGVPVDLDAHLGHRHAGGVTGLP